MKMEQCVIQIVICDLYCTIRPCSNIEMCNEFIYDPGGGDERSKRPDTSPAMSWDDEVEAQERYRETGRVSNTSYLHTMRNNEKN